MAATSALGPVDPVSVPQEDQKEATWIVRKLVGSMTGRLITSTYESLRATSTSIICLSPWGDSSPLLLPCIRFRDLAVHTVVAATGGMAAVATPIMTPVSDIIVDTLGSSILVEAGIHATSSAALWAANEVFIDKPLKKIIPVHAANLATTDIKTLTITLRYKHTMTDAQLGFFRSASHKDPSLFASMAGYLKVEKGWFNPYLYASARRPAIPRSMRPDVVFCHGPFLEGDYQIAAALVAQSARTVELCARSRVPEVEEEQSKSAGLREKFGEYNEKLASFIRRVKSPGPEDTMNSAPPVPTTPAPFTSPSDGVEAVVIPPRRLAIILVGLKPHRLGMWTSSGRPGESVLQYVLLNGAPAIIVPALRGAPLLAWNTLTLKDLHAKADDPKVYDCKTDSSNDFESSQCSEAPEAKIQPGLSQTDFASSHSNGIVTILHEYLSLCIDWTRITVGEDSEAEMNDAEKQAAVRAALALLVAAAGKSRESEAVRGKVDSERAGIVIFRMV